jgi:hypothetical protein
MTDKTVKRSIKMTDETMERINAYFDAELFLSQISCKAYESQRMFLNFARMLRQKKNGNEYNQEQLKNVLKLYLDVFNTLFLDYDYMYYGAIRILYQNAEAAKFLYQDERGTWKSKASFIWLEAEGKQLIKKKKQLDKPTKTKFKSIRAKNEEFGISISSGYRKPLREDIKEMEESGFYMQETKDELIQIINISYRDAVYAQNTTNQIKERSMITKVLGNYLGIKPSSNQQSNCLKSATIRQSATIPPTIREQSEKSGIKYDANDDSDDDGDDDDDDDDDDDVDVVGSQQSNNLKFTTITCPEEQSESKSRKNDDNELQRSIESAI